MPLIRVSIRILESVLARLVGTGKANVVAKYLIFIFGGALGLAINLVVTYLLHSVLGLRQMFAYSAGLALNVVFNFVYHRHITFNVKTETEKRFVLFTAVTLTIVAANWAAVYILAEKMGHNIYATSVIVVITVSIINFALNRLFVFKHFKHSGD